MYTQKHRYKANEMSEDSLPQSQQDKFDFDKTQSDIWYDCWLYTNVASSGFFGQQNIFWLVCIEKEILLLYFANLRTQGVIFSSVDIVI